VFLAALERSWKPQSLVEDSPIFIEEKEITNFDGRYLGRISLTRALALSRNTVAVRLIQQPEIGPETVIQTARRLGITSDLVNIPGLALGISEVTLLELTSAYCVFANGGFAVEPYGVVGVRTKRGNLRYWHQPAHRKILQHISLTRPIVRKSHASAMNSMLKAVITDPEGTGRGAQFGEYDLAGKTGTTDGYRDAWFVGFTSHLCTGVWIGNDDNSPMQRVSGGKLPVDIFREFMRDTHKYLHFENQPLP
jgi:penicillin-binding protein 1A